MHPPNPHDEQCDDGGDQVGCEEGGGVDHLLHPADPVHHDQAPDSQQHLGVLVRVRAVQVAFKLNGTQKIMDIWRSGTRQSANRTLAHSYATVEQSVTVGANSYIQTHFRPRPLGSARAVER